jgi:hypothetical protein
LESVEPSIVAEVSPSTVTAIAVEATGVCSPGT